MSNDEENPKAGEARKSNETSLPCLETQATLYERLLQQASIYGIAAGYCLSASLLSIINKWAVMKFPYPGALTALQYFTSAAGSMIGLTFGQCGRFLPAAFIFYLSLFTNSELLLHANVDTFIVSQTWMSLGTIFGGSVLYVLTDYQFTLTAYSWALAYLISMSIDFAYIKHVVMTIGLNTWGLIKHEITDESDWYSFAVILPVGLSCLFGLAISFFGFSCRRAISATGFTVLGIVNKLLTVVINLLIWDKHSTLVGTLGLLICMGGGVLYQQSTSKKPNDVKEQTKSQGSEEEQEKLIELQKNVNETNTVEKEVVGSRS
ncbi:hypothetical protein MKW92_026550 [Papaver armeniacum]|nr:hypothetical protein MKW92_026550 [Papaver armeniacum]